MLMTIFERALICSPILCAFALNAQTLEPRDLDGDFTTVEAYYDAELDLSWLADANIGQTETFGLERGQITDYGSQINADGEMLRDGLSGFIAGMNVSAYLGLSSWRLPIAPATGDLSCSSQSSGDAVFTWGFGCVAPEVGYMNQLMMDHYVSPEESPFRNLDSDERWLGSFGPSDRHKFRFGAIAAGVFDISGGDGYLSFCGVGRCSAAKVWPVHDGAIGTAIIAVAECMDTDPVGDGWGWDGVTSCRTETPALAGDCIDYDPKGDGWGWNGVESCLTDESAEEGACIDYEPRDGWGWNGVASCRADTTSEELVNPEFDCWFIDM